MTSSKLCKNCGYFERLHNPNTRAQSLKNPQRYGNPICKTFTPVEDDVLRTPKELLETVKKTKEGSTLIYDERETDKSSLKPLRKTYGVIDGFSEEDLKTSLKRVIERINVKGTIEDRRKFIVQKYKTMENYLGYEEYKFWRGIIRKFLKILKEEMGKELMR